MKRIKLICLLLTISSIAVSQTPFPSVSKIGTPTTLSKTLGAVQADSLFVNAVYFDTLSANKNPYTKTYIGGQIYTTKDSSIYVWQGKWIKQKIGGSGSGSTLYNYPALSSLPAIGDVPGNNITTDSAFRYIFYKSQPPTATLSGGGIYEFTTAGSTSRVLSWTGGRTAATATLATINVDGVNQTFTQPAQGGSVGGTKNATVPHNTNTTYSNIVTTTDGKSATATTSFTYQNKIYAGFVTSNNPTDADIIAATGSTYVGGQFSGARNQSGALSTPSSSKYFIFAAPASYGVPTITINGLGATLNLITRSFTNASGFTSSYIIAVSPFSTSGGIDSYIVN